MQRTQGKSRGAWAPQPQTDMHCGVSWEIRCIQNAPVTCCRAPTRPHRTGNRPGRAPATWPPRSRDHLRTSGVRWGKSHPACERAGARSEPNCHLPWDESGSPWRTNPGWFTFELPQEQKLGYWSTVLGSNMVRTVSTSITIWQGSSKTLDVVPCLPSSSSVPKV